MNIEKLSILIPYYNEERTFTNILSRVLDSIKKISLDFEIITANNYSPDQHLEYDQDDYRDLLTPTQKANANVVFGSRFIGVKPHSILYIWHYLENRFLTFPSNLFNNLNLSDMEVGFKAFRTSLLKQFDIEENYFGFEPEITAKVSRTPNVKIYEVGISYFGRTYDAGKKIMWKKWNQSHLLYLEV